MFKNLLVDARPQAVEKATPCGVALFYQLMRMYRLCCLEGSTVKPPVLI